MTTSQQPAARTGMSDAHLRAELRAANPLYKSAGTITGRFEMERCAYHARALADRGKSEAQTRREAMARREKFIVLPKDYDVFEEGRPVRRAKKQDKPSYDLKPPLALRMLLPAPRPKKKRRSAV